MCELLHTLNASFLECGEHAVGTEWRAVAFSDGGDGGILVMLTFTAVMDPRVCVSGRKRCFCWHRTPSQRRSS
jgi:hypothetical protein